MASKNRQMEDRLEALIDEEDLTFILERIASICWGKAEHLESNWQDSETAEEWTNAGDRIDECIPWIQV